MRTNTARPTGLAVGRVIPHVGSTSDGTASLIGVGGSGIKKILPPSRSCTFILLVTREMQGIVGQASDFVEVVSKID